MGKIVFLGNHHQNGPTFQDSELLFHLPRFFFRYVLAKKVFSKCLIQSEKPWRAKRLTGLYSCVCAVWSCFQHCKQTRHRGQRMCWTKQFAVGLNCIFMIFYWGIHQAINIYIYYRILSNETGWWFCFCQINISQNFYDDPKGLSLCPDLSNWKTSLFAWIQRQFKTMNLFVFLIYDIISYSNHTCI